jgi:hypothetical protein
LGEFPVAVLGASLIEAAPSSTERAKRAWVADVAGGFAVSGKPSVASGPRPRPAISLDRGDDIALLGVAERSPRGYAIPSGEAGPATGCRGVLGDKRRMPAHRRLLAVVLRHGGRETLRDEIGGVGKHQHGAPVVEIGALLFAEPEASAKRRRRVFGKNGIEIAHDAPHTGCDAMIVEQNAMHPPSRSFCDAEPARPCLCVRISDAGGGNGEYRAD